MARGVSSNPVGALIARFRIWLLGERQKALPAPLRRAAQAATTPLVFAAVPAPEVPEGERKERIAQRSRALAIRLFGANQPVDNPRDLFGRARELDQLVGAVLEGGMHAVIYGPRGSGKTSLVRVFGEMADDAGALVIYLSCAGGSGFGEIMLPYFDEMDPALFDMQREDYAEAVAALVANPTPRSVAGLLSRADRRDIVLILDEFDRLENATAKGQLALLVKLLSDMRARTRLVFVGISGDIGELIDMHASIRRHILSVGLAPLADKEVEDFIATTSRAIGLEFLPSSLGLLRRLVCGSPYHMRLFSLHTCLVAIEQDSRCAVDGSVLAGLDRAVQNWRGTNQRDHDLFAKVVAERRVPLSALEAFASHAATLLEFTPDDLWIAFAPQGIDRAAVPVLIEQLAPGLGRMTAGSPKLAFDDVLAPQFLLAMCAGARWNEKQNSDYALEGTMQ